MKKYLCMMLALATLSGCKDDFNGQEWATSAVTKIDITGAQMLALTGNDMRTRAGADDLGFYKVNENGDLEAVYTFETEDGKEMKSEVQLVPSMILPLSDDYVFLVDCSAQNSEGGNFIWGLNYIVRKSDGAVFYIEENDILYGGMSTYDWGYPENSDIMPRTDLNNNSYFIGYNYDGNEVVYKLALNSASNNLKIQQVSLDQFYLRHGTTGTNRMHPFEVDAVGNCITTADIYYENSSDPKVILYKANGGIYEMPKDAGVFDYFVGYDGRMCCWSYLDDNYPYSYKAFPLEIGANVEYDIKNATSIDSSIGRYNLSRPYTLENKYIHVLCTVNENETQNQMLVYNSKENTLREITCMEGEMSEAIGYNRNSIYRIMGNQIYEYNFDSNQEKLIPIDYDLNSCTAYQSWKAYNVAQGSKFILCAIRNSDMAILRIEVDMATGKTTVHEDSQEKKIISLVQIA